MSFTFFYTLFSIIQSITLQSSQPDYCSLLLDCISPTSALAASTKQSFELDINELKNRSKRQKAVTDSAVPSHKKTTRKKKKNKNITEALTPAKNILPESDKDTTQQKAASELTQTHEKLLLLNKLPSPETIPKPSSSSTIVLSRSIPPCELVPEILFAFSARVSTSEVLSGVPLAAPYALRHKNTVAAIACGISEADEITFSRLLAVYGTKLTNIVGNDSPETVINKIAYLLKLPTQIIRHSPYNDRLVYIFPGVGETGKGVFISLTNNKLMKKEAETNTRK